MASELCVLINKYCKSCKDEDVEWRWVAKQGDGWQSQGDGWLSRGWVAKLGRWVIKLGRWVAKLGRWMAKLGRWVAKQGDWWLSQGDGWLSRETGEIVNSGRYDNPMPELTLSPLSESMNLDIACYSSSLWVRIPKSLKKYKMGDICKGMANTLKHAKKYIKI